jgi:glutamine amidotransferase
MITIIDYGIGNLASVKNALDKLGVKNVISSNPKTIKQAKALILPGVGAASEGMNNLRLTGLDKVIIMEINKGKPVLGICLGMQLLFEKSEEGNVDCLGILKGKVRKFEKEKKVPQIGWNNMKMEQNHNVAIEQLFKNIANNSYFYFVNSYYCIPEDETIIAGETEYGEKFASVIIKDNIVTTQFHPEKSGKVGFQFIKNFMEIYL